MAKHTIREQLIAGLESYGAKRDEDSRSTRYAVYEIHHDAVPWPAKPGTIYAIGSNGALRGGRNVTEARPLPPQWRATILGAGIKALEAADAAKKTFRHSARLKV